MKQTQKNFSDIQARGAGVFLVVFLIVASVISFWTQRSNSLALLESTRQIITEYSRNLSRQIDTEIEMSLLGGVERSLIEDLSYVDLQGRAYKFQPMKDVSQALKNIVAEDKNVFAIPPGTTKTVFKLSGDNNNIIAYKPLLIQRKQSPERIFIRCIIPVGKLRLAVGELLPMGAVKVASASGVVKIVDVYTEAKLEPFPISVVLMVARGFFWKRMALLTLVFLVLLYGPVIVYKEMVKGTYANIFEDIQNIMYLVSSYTSVENTDSEKDLEAENMVLQKRMNYKEFAILAKALEAMRYHIKSSMSLLKQRSALDPLTHLPNRTAFQNEISNCVKSGIPFSVMFLDLDGFKQINDELGHEAGDETLKRVSQVLQQTFRRQDDLVCRYGGDEFVVLMLGDISKVADVIATRIRENIEAIDVNQLVGAEYADKQYRVSTSIGIAVFPKDSANADEVVQLADERMYKDKVQRKKNRGSSNVAEVELRL
jgi:diguanylate cyclase (GGDEF)-like protein